jgi:hypothetical protein
MAQIIKPNSEDQVILNDVSIFLAGSIEMNAAEEWQNYVQETLKDLDVTFLNPRRDDWDSSWTDKSVVFNTQVNWEMNRLDSCDIIFMYFSPETKSPISLLELGLHAESDRMVVCCPPGFWRKGNVDIVCTRYNIPLFNDMESAINGLRTKINQFK